MLVVEGYKRGFYVLSDNYTSKLKNKSGINYHRFFIFTLKELLIYSLLLYIPIVPDDDILKSIDKETNIHINKTIYEYLSNLPYLDLFKIYIIRFTKFFLYITSKKNYNDFKQYCILSDGSLSNKDEQKYNINYKICRLNVYGIYLNLE